MKSDVHHFHNINVEIVWFLSGACLEGGHGVALVPPQHRRLVIV